MSNKSKLYVCNNYLDGELKQKINSEIKIKLELRKKTQSQ